MYSIKYLEIDNMGGKKDINRVKELLFGKDIERFEKRFDALEAQQNSFEKNVSNELDKLSKMLEQFIQSQTQEIDKQKKRVIEELDTYIEIESKRNAEHLKTLKTELKMYIKSKINNLDRKKISHTELSALFSSVSDELKRVDNIEKQVK